MSKVVVVLLAFLATLSNAEYLKADAVKEKPLGDSSLKKGASIQGEPAIHKGESFLKKKAEDSKPDSTRKASSPYQRKARANRQSGPFKIEWLVPGMKNKWEDIISGKVPPGFDIYIPTKEDVRRLRRLSTGDPELNITVDFENPCVDLPAGRSPHDGFLVSDGGWRLVNYNGTGYSDPVTEGEHESDDDTASIPLGFLFTFLGQNFSDVWINTNGMVSFGGGIDRYDLDDVEVAGFPFNDKGIPFIMVAFDDVDIGEEMLGSNDPANATVTEGEEGHIWWRQDGETFAVAWDHVDSFGNDRTSLSTSNTFQIILAPSGTSGSSLGSTNNVCLCYDNIGWLVEQFAVGFDNGDGVNGFAIENTDDLNKAQDFAQSNPVLCYDISSSFSTKSGKEPKTKSPKTKAPKAPK